MIKIKENNTNNNINNNNKINTIADLNATHSSNQHLPLDYSLSQPERVKLVREIAPIAHESQLELLTNYILHGEKSKKLSQSKKDQPLQSILHSQINAPIRYSNPKQELKNTTPFLPQIEEAREQMLLLSKHHNCYKAKRAAIELAIDKGLVQSTYTKPHNPNPDFTPDKPIEIDKLVNLTNSFHIAKILQYYSALRQSTESKLWIEEFDKLIDNTPLQDWQRYLIARRIDGVYHTTIGVELGEKFNKAMSPNSLSNAMRVIYRRIARQAEKEKYIWDNKDNKDAWQICRRCKVRKIRKYDFFPSKPTICKECWTGKTKEVTKK